MRASLIKRCRSDSFLRNRRVNRRVLPRQSYRLFAENILSEDILAEHIGQTLPFAEPPASLILRPLRAYAYFCLKRTALFAISATRGKRRQIFFMRTCMTDMVITDRSDKTFLRRNGTGAARKESLCITTVVLPLQNSRKGAY